MEQIAKIKMRDRSKCSEFFLILTSKEPKLIHLIHNVSAIVCQEIQPKLTSNDNISTESPLLNIYAQNAYF